MGSRVSRTTFFCVSLVAITLGSGSCGGVNDSGKASHDGRVVIAGGADHSAGGTRDVNAPSAADAKACADDQQCPRDSRCRQNKCVDKNRTTKKGALSNDKKGTRQPNCHQERFGHRYPRLVLVPPSSEGGVICGPGKIKECVQKCEQGMAAYCLAVGRFYEPLFMKDEHSEFALFGFQKACDSGVSDGCVALGIIFYNGRLVPPQHEKAYHFSLKACELNNSAGCANGARLAARGVGISQNASLAKKLFDKACQLGHEPSCTDYDILEKRAPTSTANKNAEEQSGFADPRQTNGTDVAWVMCSTLEACDANLLAKIFTNIDFCVSQFNSSTFSTRKCRRFSPEFAAQCIQDIRALECNVFINTLFNRVPQPGACEEMCQ